MCWLVLVSMYVLECTSSYMELASLLHVIYVCTYAAIMVFMSHVTLFTVQCRHRGR